ncbi:MAG: signal peptidase [Thermotogota bacterium]|nr:signal peptidase [Thermotogota bacterium]MDK2864547.1 signal peptidase [Thermotogota bacterium]
MTPRERFLHELKEWGKALIYALIFGTMIRVFVFETMMVPTGSMIPTIMPGDRLFIEKITLQLSEPEIGDTVIFWAPFVDKNALSMLRPFDKFMDLFSPSRFRGHVKYVKRLVGKPGDVLELEPVSGMGMYRLKVNGKVPPGFENRYYVRAGIFLTPDFWRMMAYPDEFKNIVTSSFYQFLKYYNDALDFDVFYEEYLKEYDNERYVWQDESGNVKVRVPPGHYFFMGDNSRESFDCRYFGFVPVENVVGSPMLRIWPLKKFGVLGR